MKRKIGEFFLLFILVPLALSGCFSPWKGDEATLTLLFGNTAGRAAVPDGLVHTIELDGPTGRQSHTIKGNTFSVTVMPGYWKIRIQALKDGILFAEGEGGADIIAGRNNTVVINMNPLVVINTLDYNEFDTPIPGSLRYALSIAEEGETIRFRKDVVIPGESVIKLTMPLSITKSITIEGGGITLTPADFWDGGSLLNVNDSDSTVKISRVHFRDGEAVQGGAISNNGRLTLESCIFNGNIAYNSGAIYNHGYLYLKGCTFYKNNAYLQGGAVYNEGGNIELTGNLFYENSARSDPVTGSDPQFIKSKGYNVVDYPFAYDSPTGGDNCGWNQAPGDTTFLDFFGDLIDTGTFKPILPALNSIVPSSLQSDDFPSTDFYGKSRFESHAANAPGAVSAFDD